MKQKHELPTTALATIHKSCDFVTSLTSTLFAFTTRQIANKLKTFLHRKNSRTETPYLLKDLNRIFTIDALIVKIFIQMIALTRLSPLFTLMGWVSAGPSSVSCVYFSI